MGEVVDLLRTLTQHDIGVAGGAVERTVILVGNLGLPPLMVLKTFRNPTKQAVTPRFFRLTQSYIRIKFLFVRPRHTCFIPKFCPGYT